MIGIIKENTDVEGVQTFQRKFFPFPLYIDEEKGFYKALGNRKRIIFNLMRSYSGLKKRLKKKGNIKGNYKGEGLLQGGVLLVSSASGGANGMKPHAPGLSGEPQPEREGKVLYQYVEQSGREVPVNDIEQAVLNAL
mmetsp:Transcript_4840/g.9126  ORF Transcript_4840/g.9126 Transcript_4840/m.9126 type:complete len:137 (+) Transcript_4840:360-770(+)